MLLKSASWQTEYRDPTAVTQQSSDSIAAMTTFSKGHQHTPHLLFMQFGNANTVIGMS